MPILKSAIKKLKQDKQRAKRNQVYRSRYKEALKKAKKTRSKKDIKAACQALDRAGKKRVIHKNKAARLKSRLVKFVKG